MKFLLLNFTVLLFINTSFADDKKQLNDNSSRINYSVGYQIGSDFRLQQFELNPEAILKGIEDALSEKKPVLSTTEMRQSMADLGQKVAALKREKKQQAVLYSKKNKEFLSSNVNKPGVTVTESGLQYRIIEQGSGEIPSAHDQVLVHYRGKLIDGTEFDSSFKRGKPASFKVDRVIKGWTEALQLMPRGSHWQLIIPSELAYGQQGAGKSIPPNSTLIFDVELLSIKINR